MSLPVSFVFLLLSFAVSILAQDYPCDGSRTPMTIETDFLNNCSNLNFNSTVCSKAWEAFKSAFANKNPVLVTAKDYQSYFNVIPIEKMANQSLFWSGTFQVVNIISMMNSAGVKLVSSTNAPASAIINNLGLDVSWCGIGGGGIDYDNPCLCNVTNLFWEQFSYLFSQAAKGIVFYLSNGERRNGTYRTTSIFSRVELPSLNTAVVSKVVALVIHRKGKGESCSDNGNSTLKTLRDHVTQRSLMFDCYDILGNINDTSIIADCAAHVVKDIQLGVESSDNQINCTSGANRTTLLEVCLIIVMISSLFYVV